MSSSSLDIFYGKHWDESEEFHAVVNFRINGNKPRKPYKRLEYFDYIDIEYKNDYLITFRPGVSKTLKQTLYYDKSLYHYLIKILVFLTGWSELIIKSYFIYE